MDRNRAEELLARYEKGETNRSEEQELQRYFAQEESLPPHLEAEKAYFRSLAHLRQTEAEVPEGLEMRLSHLIDGLERREKGSAHHRFRWAWPAGIAAAAAVVLAMVLWQPRTAVPPTPQDTFATAEEASAEVERALTAFAEALGKGEKAIEEANKEAGQIKETIHKQLDNINYRKS